MEWREHYFLLYGFFSVTQQLNRTNLRSSSGKGSLSVITGTVKVFTSIQPNFLDPKIAARWS